MADYDQLTYCRLVGLYNGIVADTVGNFGDADARPDLYAPWMDATITVRVAGQAKTPELRLTDVTPPRTMLLIPITARVEGGIFRLPGQTEGVDGVDIIAKSARMGLGDTPLLCTVSFGPATLAGRSYQYDPVTFVLPTVEPADYAAGRVQIITLMGGPTAGSWRLLYDNITTPGMTVAVTSGQLQTNLRALAPIGTNVTVVAGPGPSQFTVTFTGALGAGNPSPLVAKDALTGGDNPWVRVQDAYTPVTLDLSTVERVDSPPSTPSALVIRQIPDDVRPAGDGFQLFSQNAPLGEVIPLPSASWPSIMLMPQVIAAGDTEAEARDAIGAVSVDGAEEITGAKTFTGGLRVEQAWGSLDLVNPLPDQYSATGFKMHSEATSFAANPAGVQLVSGVADAAATEAYAELATVSRTGGFLQALVQWALPTRVMKILGRLDMASNRITNVADPVDPQDAITKAFGDARFELASRRGQPGGYPSLDGSGRMPAAQMPVSVMEYQGVWNATTNTPALANGTGSTGDVYRVGTAGTRNLGAGNLTFDVGDYVIYNGAVWEKSDTTDAVASVAGLTGVIAAAGLKAALSLGSVDNTPDSTKTVAAAATVSNGGALNSPASGNLANCTGYAAANVVQPIKTGVFQFSHANQLAATGSPASFNIRRGFSFPFQPTRFRVHIPTKSMLADTTAAGQLSNFTLGVGLAALTANGEPAGGATVGAPLQIQTSTTLYGGATLVTPWVDAAAFTAQADRLHILTAGFSVGATDQIAIGGGLQWTTFNRSDALTAAPATTRGDNGAWLGGMFIEAEGVFGKLIFVVGNSLSDGGNVGGVPNRGELDAWQNQWARMNRGVAASISVGGSWAAMYGAASPKWTHYSTLANPLVPDGLLYMGLASSDVAGSAGDAAAIAAAQASMTAAVTKGRAMFPSALHIGTTLPPRGASTGTPETARITMNRWLSGCPAGLDRCIDISSALTDWASPARLREPFAAAPASISPPLGVDIDHWSPDGHSVVAGLVRL